MNKHGFKILAAASAALALAGCLNGADQKSDAEIAREKQFQFIGQTSAAAVQAAGIPSNAEISASLDALGCPKLSKLFTDFSSYQGTTANPFPQSFKEHLACFGINGNGTINDIDSVTAKFRNPTQLLDCMCGSTALSTLVAGKFEVFNVQASAAAEIFNVSESKPADVYDGSSSQAADNFSN